MFLMGLLALVLIVVGISWPITNAVTGGVAPARIRLGWILSMAGVLIFILAMLGVFPVD